MSMNEMGRAPSRREFLVLGAGVFAVTAAAGVTSWQRRQLVRRTLPVMGTLAEVAVVARDPRVAHAAIDAAFAELHEVDRLMTRFNDTSDIGRANVGAWRGPVVISAASAAVIAESLRWARVQDSRFDPAIGRATTLWDVSRRTAPPAAAEVHRLARRGLHRAVELDMHRGEHVLRYHEPDAALDLGGIAKGHAVDRAVAALRNWGITDALVNAGGDLYALGNAGDGEPWRVGIRSAADASRIAHSFALTDAAVATSGDYEQYFDYDGRRYHHLIDPVTAAPRAVAAHSLTVSASDCMTADAAATAAFGLGDDVADRIVADGSARDARIIRTT
jgi:FAD:protein FMN transferase